MSQHESNTIQHESRKSQHESDTSQHELARVKKFQEDSTRVNTSPMRLTCVNWRLIFS